jgi:hypothetical protein
MRKIVGLVAIAILAFVAIGTAYSIWQKNRPHAELDSCSLRESYRLVEKEQQHIPRTEAEEQWLQRCLEVGRADFKTRHPELYEPEPAPTDRR